MTSTQRGCQLLRALGCESRLICTLVAEVPRWRAWGALEQEDYWAIAARVVWEVRTRQPAATCAYIRTRVRWEILRALNAERRSHGWRCPHGGAWMRATVIDRSALARRAAQARWAAAA